MNTARVELPSFNAAIAVDGPVPALPTRARLGVILPSVNTVVEPWFNLVLPAGVHVHSSRMLLESEVTPESLRRMDMQEGLPSAQRLAGCRPHAVAYCCTASSIVQGLDYDHNLQHELQQLTGVPCCTAVGAILKALKHLGARRIAVASPYSDAIDRAEHRFLESAGFEVVGAANLGIGDSFGLAEPGPEQIYELARRAWHPDADALLISCLNMNSQAVVHMLEQLLGRPVITSTTATLWKLMRSAGIADCLPGYGTLLAGHRLPASSTIFDRPEHGRN